MNCASCSRRLQLARLKLSIKYRCCGGSLQSSHQKNIRFDCKMTGIEVVLPDGEKKKSKVIVLSGHFDLPAHAGVTEQVTYIGHDSCCYCYEHG